MKHIEPEYITTVTVLKDKDATKLYGAAGEQGVVQIHTDQDIFSAFNNTDN